MARDRFFNVIKACFLIVASALFLIACEADYVPVEERASRAAESNNEIHIGIVSSLKVPSLFVQGVTMAVEEVNARGGVLDRKLKTIVRDDYISLTKGQKIAAEFSKNPDIVAVIGHRYSGVAIPVSVTYEKSGILFLSPGATSPLFTQYGGDFVFRNIPANDIFAQHMAEFCYKHNFKRMAVIYERESVGRLLTELFKEDATDLGIKITSTKSYFRWQKDFRKILSEILVYDESYSLSNRSMNQIKKKNVPADIIERIESVKNIRYKSEEAFLEALKGAIGEELALQYHKLIIKQAEYQREELGFDAVFLGGLLPYGANLIKQARDMGIDVPFIGSADLDSPDLFSVAGDAAEGVIVPTVFNPERPARETREFVNGFQSRFGIAPDVWAAQGYDAVKLLCHAMEESNSTVPLVVASALKIIENWKGVTGIYSFNKNGDISGKAIYFKEHRKGKFEYLDYEVESEKTIDPFYAMEETTLRLPLEGVIPTIDPGMTEDMVSIELTEQLFLGLTDFDPGTYEAVPELATDWLVSDDRKRYTFHLRRDVVWTDDIPVTAHDIIWAVRRNAARENGSPYAYMLYILKNAKAFNTGKISDPSKIGVYALDDYTVVFELEHAASYFPSIAGLWVFRPIPRHIVEKYGTYWTDPANIQTNGSYKVASWRKGIMMILEKNKKYFDAANVSIPEVRYYVIPESSLGLMMYENNELDIIGGNYLRIPLMGIPRIKNDPKLSREYTREPHFCTYAYGFNTQLEPVNNPLVRKAIAAAIDRRLIIDLVTQGDEEVALTFTRPPVFGAVDQDSDIGIKFNPIQAKKWLKKAGYETGASLPPLKLSYNSSETHLKIAQAIQSSLKYYLDISIILEEIPWESFMDEIRANPSHIFRFGWCGDYPDANSWLAENFHPTRSPNYVRWKSKEYADVLDRASSSSDSVERRKLYKRAEQILCQEQAAVVPIFFETAHCLVKPRIKGFYHMAIGGQHIRNWSFKE